MTPTLAPEGKIYGVSLGPGDPELITVKGLRALQLADLIYYPGSVQPDGQQSSYSLGILRELGLDETKLRGLFLPMRTDRTAALQGYEQVFYQIKADYEAGRTVAFVSEGDSTFYSTFAYLLAHLHDHQLPVEIIAGVPSFLLATAAHQVPLAVLREKVAVIPLLASAAALEGYLRDFETVVLIKVRGALDYVRPAVAAGHATAYYAERLGTPAQYLTTDLADLAGRELPYFSLLILKSLLCN
jgi:precorrin-2/cobalt-factor-2 C20-methyltransferase